MYACLYVCMCECMYACMYVFFAQVGSCWRSWALSWLILALLGSILSPSCSKMAPRWPNIAQHRAKMNQHSLQEPPTRPPKTPKCGQNAIVVLIFTLQPFLQRSAPRPPKIPKIAPQLASRWPARPCLGPSWLHLGPILPPSSPILVPFWASRACPKSAKICQDSPQDIFLPKVAPKTSQTPSRLSGSIFQPFWVDFS